MMNAPKPSLKPTKQDLVTDKKIKEIRSLVELQGKSKVLNIKKLTYAEMTEMQKTKDEQVQTIINDLIKDKVSKMKIKRR